MTSATLAALNGLLALEASNRAKAGDRRDKSEIVDEILDEAHAPAIEGVIRAIEAMIRMGYRPGAQA